MYVYIQYQLYLYTSQIYSANMQSTSLTETVKRGRFPGLLPS